MTLISGQSGQSRKTVAVGTWAVAGDVAAGEDAAAMADSVTDARAGTHAKKKTEMARPGILRRLFMWAFTA
jgi:Na+/H+ antiporter NhaB